MQKAHRAENLLSQLGKAQGNNEKRGDFKGEEKRAWNGIWKSWKMGLKAGKIQKKIQNNKENQSDVHMPCMQQINNTVAGNKNKQNFPGG